MGNNPEHIMTDAGANIAQIAPEQAADGGKKRPLEGGDEGDAKRTAYGEATDDVALKILVPNPDAGAVIGKGGSVISQIQNDSKAKVKMSQNGDFFPGTMDRVVLITGTGASVFEGLSLIVNTIAAGKQAAIAADTEQSAEVKIAIPHAAAGGIIGKGGATIRSITETSGAKVQLSQVDEMHPDLKERLCTTSGTISQVLAAAQLILQKLQEADATYTNLSTNYARAMQSAPQAAGYGHGMQAGGMYGGAPAMPYGMPQMYGQQQQPNQQHAMMQAQARAMMMQPQQGAAGGAGATTTTIQVPDGQVGAIVGKGGESIKQIQMQTGTRVQVSQRDDSGADRTVTITGEAGAVQLAHQYITAKMNEASNRAGM